MLFFSRLTLCYLDAFTFVINNAINLLADYTTRTRSAFIEKSRQENHEQDCEYVVPMLSS